MFKLKDKRIKGCWNPLCRSHKKHLKFKSDDIYCPKCGRELVYVCAKCGRMMEDRGRKHTVCDHCIERKEANAAARKEATASVLSAIAAVGNLIAEKISRSKTKQISESTSVDSDEKPETDKTTGKTVRNK